MSACGGDGRKNGGIFSDGNAPDVAERIGREAKRRGFPVSIVSTEEFDPSSLPHEKAIVFVISTSGQGDSPDSFMEFWRFLLQRNLGNSWLQRVCFALFGLGDSGYQMYNFVAKKLDKIVLDLGATTIIEKGLGDDQHPSGVSDSIQETLEPGHRSYHCLLRFISDSKAIPRDNTRQTYDQENLGEVGVSFYSQ